jgi:hypothetical protein
MGRREEGFGDQSLTVRVEVRVASLCVPRARLSIWHARKVGGFAELDPTTEKPGQVDEDRAAAFRDVSEHCAHVFDRWSPVRVLFPVQHARTDHDGIADSMVPQPVQHKSDVPLRLHRIDTTEGVISTTEQNHDLRLAFVQRLLDALVHIGGRIAGNT